MRAFTPERRGDRPNTLALPSEVLRRPARILKAVDLPEPLGPRIPKISPRRISNVAFSKARTNPGFSKYLLTCRIVATISRGTFDKVDGFSCGVLISKQVQEKHQNSNGGNSSAEICEDQRFVVLEY